MCAARWTAYDARMLHAQRLPLQFDPAPLQAGLDAYRDDEWIDHFVPDNYEGRWRVLPLRAPAGETHPIRLAYPDPTATQFVDTAWLGRAPAYRAAIDAIRGLGGAPQAARLMSLGAGSRILPHRDHDLAAEEGVARLHVPVCTNEQVDFRVGGQRVVMAAGECWYLRLVEEHSVVNGGETDRVHLVVDVELVPGGALAAELGG